MTLRACIIGHPVAHSRSPLIHRHWLAAYGIDGDYRREDVPPECISAFLASFPQSGYVGANVTVPHKEAAFRLARPDPLAAALGAVNTLWHENGVLYGENTDVRGFLAHLDQSQPGWDQRVTGALVLGAGGVARAVVHGLLQRRIAGIVVVNRSPDRARDLAAHFAGRIVTAPLAELPARLAAAALLVNATSLGMTGQPPLDLDLAALPRDAIVYDLVYAPLETELLAAARARRLETVDGLGMLLHQAAPAFARWFGVRPEVTPALRALVAADLRGEGKR